MVLHQCLKFFQTPQLHFWPWQVALWHHLLHHGLNNPGTDWGQSILSWGEVYCITPALDRYIMLLDRIPHTWMITSLNICGMAFYDHWHPCLHLSLFYFHPSILLPSDCFHLSQAPMDKTYLWLILMKLGYHPQISQPQPDLWHLALWRRCGKCDGRDRK